MKTYRKVAFRTGVALGVSALALAGTAPTGTALGGTVASATGPTASIGVVPPAAAPHVGHVAGVRYGSAVKVDNPQSVHAFRVLHRSLIATSKGETSEIDERIHPSAGTSFNADTVGSQATQSVSRKIKPARSDTTLYTPTMYPSGGDTNGSCIEMSTAYFSEAQVVAAWDWCQRIGFVAEVPIDRSFMTVYTKHHYYSTQIVQTSESPNRWASYLYNYTTGTWEKFFAQRGTSDLKGVQGWDVYELYSEVDENDQSYACADLEGKRVEARGIMVGVDGKLVPAAPGNSGRAYDSPPYNFHCDTFSYEMLEPYQHWRSIG